jgi:hypothetical protein
MPIVDCRLSIVSKVDRPRSIVQLRIAIFDFEQSAIGNRKIGNALAGLAGFEPATFCLEDRRSNPLSYRPGRRSRSCRQEQELSL